MSGVLLSKKKVIKDEALYSCGWGVLEYEQGWYLLGKHWWLILTILCARYKCWLGYDVFIYKLGKLSMLVRVCHSYSSVSKLSNWRREYYLCMRLEWLKDFMFFTLEIPELKIQRTTICRLTVSSGPMRTSTSLNPKCRAIQLLLILPFLQAQIVITYIVSMNVIINP